MRAQYCNQLGHERCTTEKLRIARRLTMRRERQRGAAVASLSRALREAASDWSQTLCNAQLLALAIQPTSQKMQHRKRVTAHQSPVAVKAVRRREPAGCRSMRSSAARSGASHIRVAGLTNPIYEGFASFRAQVLTEP